jgi:hypothetical protein
MYYHDSTYTTTWQNEALPDKSLKTIKQAHRDINNVN